MKVRKRILVLLLCGIIIGSVLPVSAEENRMDSADGGIG